MHFTRQQSNRWQPLRGAIVPITSWETVGLPQEFLERLEILVQEKLAGSGKDAWPSGRIPTEMVELAVQAAQL